MTATDLHLETYPGTDTISLTGLHTSVIVTLGSLSCPVDFATIIAELPSDCQSSFDSHARNIGFPGKPVEQPGQAFFEYHFLRFGAWVEYVYGDPNGFVLSEAGRNHYAKLVTDHEQKDRIFPDAQSAPDSRLYQLGSDALVALRPA